MGDELDGARLKVVRAQEHLDSLRAEIEMYMSEEPYEVVTEQQGEMRSFEAVVKIPPPARLSTIVGDCLTNANAVLDYILWELVARHAPAVTHHPTLSKKLAYPIRQPVDPPGDAYVNKINFLANRLPAPVVKQIEAVQPNNPAYVPLGWLNKLVNMDKHRAPLLTISRLDNVTVTQLIGDRQIDLATGSGKISVPQLGPEMQMHAKTSCFITFGNVGVPYIPVGRLLEQIVETVAKVIPEFEPLF
jgi:hypothetical protein